MTETDAPMRPFLFVLAVLASVPAFAGSIEGTVREKGTRRPIPGAMVAVVKSDLSTFTDDQGAFVETADVWWFMNHYETYCRENGIAINPKLYL